MSYCYNPSDPQVNLGMFPQPAGYHELHVHQVVPVYPEEAGVPETLLQLFQRLDGLDFSLIPQYQPDAFICLFYPYYIGCP